MPCNAGVDTEAMNVVCAYGMNGLGSAVMM